MCILFIFKKHVSIVFRVNLQVSGFANYKLHGLTLRKSVRNVNLHLKKMTKTLTKCLVSLLALLCTISVAITTEWTLTKNKAFPQSEKLEDKIKTVNADTIKNTKLEERLPTDVGISEENIFNLFFPFLKRDIEENDKKNTSHIKKVNKKQSVKISPNVVYLDSKSTDDKHDVEKKLKHESGSKEKDFETEYSGEDFKLENHKISRKQDEEFTLISNPPDIDDYKIAYQKKKTALYKMADTNDKLVEEPNEKSAAKNNEKKSGIDSLVYGRSNRKKSSSKKENQKKKDEDSYEDYEDEYDDEDDEDVEDSNENHSTPKESEENDRTSNRRPPTRGYDSGFSNFPRGGPPLYLPSAPGTSASDEETVEETDDTTNNRNRTFIDVPYRYIPFPYIDVLGYAYNYPWLTTDGMEDAFPFLNSNNNGTREFTRPAEEFKTEVVDIDDKKYLLRTRSIKIGNEGEGRAYVSLVSITPITDEEAKVLKGNDSEEKPSLVKTKEEERKVEQNRKRLKNKEAVLDSSESEGD